MADFPSTTDASDVWSLKDNYKAEAGDNWPSLPVGITATGGTVTTDGDYKIHTFTSSGTFTVSDAGNQGGTCECLVTSGGQSGGPTASADPNLNRHGGTGGGSYYSTTVNFNAAGSYTMTIGAGGSGGGGAYGSASTMQYNGGSQSPSVSGGAAGGAQHTDGSEGTTYFSNVYGSGGGGGAHDSQCSNNGSGGTNAGDGSPCKNIRNPPYGDNAVANRGGGGGGAGWNGAYTNYGGQGGSGIVIIRYQYQNF